MHHYLHNKKQNEIHVTEDDQNSLGDNIMNISNLRDKIIDHKLGNKKTKTETI